MSEKQDLVHLYVVNVERTYSCEFVVAATSVVEACKLAKRDLAPDDDGDSDMHASVLFEVKEASQLPYGVTVKDYPDTSCSGVSIGASIGQLLGSQESPEERAARVHNEQMAKLQGVLF